MSCVMRILIINLIRSFGYLNVYLYHPCVYLYSDTKQAYVFCGVVLFFLLFQDEAFIKKPIQKPDFKVSFYALLAVVIA